MTATQETSEYVVYRVGKRERLNYVSRQRWDNWSDDTKAHGLTELVAEGLTEEQAYQFASLTKET
jgi:hypothetical protein